ncbi:SET domain-containing protein SmydA-8-like [Topomyia yanbarensis]|uniref:SET domain-containing protein SmydA-8-like n=1 Tax=Topomyia yanbarensis TaxID=2498891 RepID=UPI00273CF477|nr:SET domain-containing protein SmydA-8-like [Topomyia yanbarensis]
MSGFEQNFQVLHSEELGRFVVAKRDIPSGEQILLENPYVTGPYYDADISCLNCFKESCCTCSKCGKAPLCYDCHGHDDVECDFYRKSNLDKNFIYNHFSVITPVRCLLLYRIDQDRYNEMMRMEAYLEERRGTEIWDVHEKCVVKPLLENGIFENFGDLEVTGELIQRICGILDMNTFELRGNDDSPGMQLHNLARGLFPKTALMTHSCIPNTLLSIDGSSNVRVYTTVPVKMGEILHNSYTRSLLGTYDRQIQLREGRHFTCYCKRCRDPTELGTHLSSIRCTECADGLCSFYPDNPRWECNKCRQFLKREYVNEILCAARSEIIDCSPEIRDLEKVISKHSRTLNPCHALVLEAKQTLVGELRNIYMSLDPANVPKQVLKRKFELCDEILRIVRILEPGVSRLAGIAMYEYHVALVQLSRRNFDTTEIKSHELLDNLIKAEIELKQAISMLLFEDASTPEGQLAKRAMRELKALREEIAEVRAMIEDENLDMQDQYRNRSNVNANNNYNKKKKYTKRR